MNKAMLIGWIVEQPEIKISEDENFTAYIEGDRAYIKFLMKPIVALKTALAKQIPFKPENQRITYGKKLGDCYCCGTVFQNENYCPKCGQKLDWGVDGFEDYDCKKG